MSVGAVTFMSPIALLGGAERALLDLLGSLRGGRPDVRPSVIVGEDGPLVDAARGLGVEVEVVAMPAGVQALGEAGGAVRHARALATQAWGLGAYVARLRGALRDLSPDVVHTNGMKAHVLGALAAARVAPVVWHVRDLVGARRWAPRALRALSPAARGAIAVSNLVAADLRACRFRGPVEVVHDAVDLERLSPGEPSGDAGARLDAEGGATPSPAGTVRVGLIATYAGWKGHRVFLEAAARVPRAARARFYVVGGPIYHTAGSQVSQAELRALADALGIGDRVAFVGFQPDPAWVYRALDVVVHASTAPEPFGLTIAEALACGRAVVASSTAGAVELIERDRDALVVSPGDPEALAAALARLIGDPDLRAELGRRGRVVAARRLDRRRLAGAVLAAYARLGVA